MKFGKAAKMKANDQADIGVVDDEPQRWIGLMVESKPPA